MNELKFKLKAFDFCIAPQTKSKFFLFENSTLLNSVKLKLSNNHCFYFFVCSCCLHSLYTPMNTTLLLSKWGRRLGRQLMKPIQKKKPEAPTSNRWKIVRGDLVEVINGPQSGQRGKVKDVLRKMNRIVVDGVNMVSMYGDISLGSSKYSVFLAAASCETSFIGNARQESD
jgi:hypothetical protein